MITKKNSLKNILILKRIEWSIDQITEKDIEKAKNRFLKLYNELNSKLEKMNQEL